MKCLSHVLTTFNPMLRSSLIAACVALCAAVVCVPAVAAPEDSMLANIKDAKARLDRTESKISKERVALANELRALEQQVMKLRNETKIGRASCRERV